MTKTLRLSFALKNTYRVNGILHGIKQIPLLKRILPESLYRVRGLKIFANILSVLWEVLYTFGAKFLYVLMMVYGAAGMYDCPSETGLFLHIWVFLSLMGAFTNTYMFNPSRDKYYALMLMRMDARDYTLINYAYSLFKLIVGLLPFTIIFGYQRGVPVWMCLLIPFFIAGLKIGCGRIRLRRYEKTGVASNENQLGRWGWIVWFLLFAAAYGLPALKITLTVPVSLGVMGAGILWGLLSLKKIYAFEDYKDMYRQILAQWMSAVEVAKAAPRIASQRAISADRGITSRKSGFEFLNELFIKRHRKILWKSAEKIAGICAVTVLAMMLGFYLMPPSRDIVNRMLLTFLPYFVFIMYMINRGTGFTQALFMNCDRSLLTYSFYKEPRYILRLFRIRLGEIMKINLLPAAVIGPGLALLLCLSGGTDNVLNYVAIVVSILCISMFFSVHYLTIYYLLQPYNVGTEIKSGTYRIILWITYMICFVMMRVRMSTLVFGAMAILFCVLYCVIACILVYKFAPKTFRLRM